MDAQQLIATRRTRFKFADRPVPEAALLRAVEAARWAPNHKRTEPWRFLLAGPELEAKLARHFRAKLVAKLEAKGASPEEVAATLAAQRPVPMQVAVTQLLDADPYRQHEDFAATCCAVQNFSLALWAEGIASGWKSFDAPACYDLLGLDPQAERIVALIQLGYPTEGPMHEGKRRLGVAELLRRSP